ncbi:MAG TPA: hypothetical protein VNC78_12140 [Actinomycetota bacterium]|nr:hypothetical protein [Actinomycetota bacterium]
MVFVFVGFTAGRLLGRRAWVLTATGLGATFGLISVTMLGASIFGDASVGVSPVAVLGFVLLAVMTAALEGNRTAEHEKEPSYLRDVSG